MWKWTSRRISGLLRRGFSATCRKSMSWMRSSNKKKTNIIVCVKVGWKIVPWCPIRDHKPPNSLKICFLHNSRKIKNKREHFRPKNQILKMKKSIKKTNKTIRWCPKRTPEASTASTISKSTKWFKNEKTNINWPKNSKIGWKKL